MIRKLRLKFVAICMVLITAVLAVVLLSVYFAMQRNIQDLSRQLLYRVIQQSASHRSEIAISLDRDRLVYLPYFTVDVWGATAYVTGGTYGDLENTAELAAILKDCLGQNQREGVVQAYHLRYLRQDNGLYEKLAFADMSMEQAMLREMMGSYLVPRPLGGQHPLRIPANEIPSRADADPGPGGQHVPCRRLWRGLPVRDSRGLRPRL